VIAKPPRSRTTRGRFFFNRAQRDFSLDRHFVDVLGHLGVLAGLGQQPGDVQIRLPPCLVVDFPFHSGKARRITHQAIQPLHLALGQQPSRLVRDGGWRGCRRTVGTLTLTLTFSLFLVPAHLLFRLQKHFHDGLLPSCESPVLFGLRPLAYLNLCSLVRHRFLGSDPLHNDSTTITFHGAYADATQEEKRGQQTRMAITWGYNKDHRPDLKQLLYILTVARDGAVPLYFQVASGNVVDDQTHRATWDLLCRLTGRRDFLYVADCKLATTENMAHIHQHQGRFLTVLPRTRSEDRAFQIGRAHV
jgi:hypothetical protein